MLFQLECDRDGVRRIDIDGRNVLKRPVRLNELPDVLKFLYAVDGIGPDGIDITSILRGLGDGEPKISTEGRYDPLTKSFLIDVTLNGHKIAERITGEKVSRIIGAIDRLTDFRRTVRDTSGVTEVLDFPFGRRMITPPELVPPLPGKKIHRKVVLEIERALLYRDGMTIDEIETNVVKSDCGKKVSKNDDLKTMIAQAMNGMKIVRDGDGRYHLQEPERPLKYEERSIDVLRVMYKVDPDKTKREGWKMRELKTATKMDINALNKVVRYMKFQKKLRVVGGLGKVNNAYRYAPADYDYGNFKSEYDRYVNSRGGSNGNPEGNPR